MTTIPREVTIALDDLQRSAIQSLMDATLPGYELADLLQLLLTKGLAAMLVGRDLPEPKRQSCDSPMTGYHLPCSTGAAVDYLGFPIDEEQAFALDDLMASHPHLTEEEVARILLDVGIRDIHNDAFAQELLAATRSEVAQ